VYADLQQYVMWVQWPNAIWCHVGFPAIGSKKRTMNHAHKRMCCEWLSVKNTSLPVESVAVLMLIKFYELFNGRVWLTVYENCKLIKGQDARWICVWSVPSVSREKLQVTRCYAMTWSVEVFTVPGICHMRVYGRIHTKDASVCICGFAISETWVDAHGKCVGIKTFAVSGQTVAVTCS